MSDSLELELQAVASHATQVKQALVFCKSSTRHSHNQLTIALGPENILKGGRRKVGDGNKSPGQAVTVQCHQSKYCPSFDPGPE